MLGGLGVPVRPAGRATESETVSVNPLTGATASCEACESPLTIVSVSGLAVRVKPTTFTANWVVRSIEPLLP